MTLAAAAAAAAAANCVNLLVFTEGFWEGYLPVRYFGIVRRLSKSTCLTSKPEI